MHLRPAVHRANVIQKMLKFLWIFTIDSIIIIIMYRLMYTLYDIWFYLLV